MNQSAFALHPYGMVSAMEIRSGELARAAVTGDEGAFTELVARHHRDLLRVAYVICRDAALAEDAAQAAWTIAWRRIGDVRDRDQIRAWLVAVAANEARRTMRSRRPGIREISVADVELEGVPDLRADPLAAGIANTDLRRVLAALDPVDRALLALRCEAGSAPRPAASAATRRASGRSTRRSSSSAPPGSAPADRRRGERRPWTCSPASRPPS